MRPARYIELPDEDGDVQRQEGMEISGLSSVAFWYRENRGMILMNWVVSEPDGM